jgi:hypothetical protein
MCPPLRDGHGCVYMKYTVLLFGKDGKLRRCGHCKSRAMDWREIENVRAASLFLLILCDDSKTLYVYIVDVPLWHGATPIATPCPGEGKGESFPLPFSSAIGVNEALRSMQMQAVGRIFLFFYSSFILLLLLCFVPLFSCVRLDHDVLVPSVAVFPSFCFACCVDSQHLPPFLPPLSAMVSCAYAPYTLAHIFPIRSLLLPFFLSISPSAPARALCLLDQFIPFFFPPVFFHFFFFFSLLSFPFVAFYELAL